VPLDDAHRLLREDVSRIAPRQVQSRQHVTVEVYSAQLATARPVLQSRSTVSIEIILNKISEIACMLEAKFDPIRLRHLFTLKT
jgi:hypothetical protein